MAAKKKAKKKATLQQRTHQSLITGASTQRGRRSMRQTAAGKKTDAQHTRTLIRVGIKVKARKHGKKLTKSQVTARARRQIGELRRQKHVKHPRGDTA